MNLISYPKKKIYIHIPKNGGHSIVELLTGTLAVPLKDRPDEIISYVNKKFEEDFTNFNYEKE